MRPPRYRLPKVAFQNPLRFEVLLMSKSRGFQRNLSSKMGSRTSTKNCVEEREEMSDESSIADDEAPHK